MARSVLITGPQVAAYVNARLFAEVAELEYASSTPRRAIQGVDTLQPVEYVPTGASIAGTMQIWRRRQAGGIEAAGLVATYPDLTLEKYFTLTLIDLASDTVVFQGEGCVVESQRWSVGHHHVRGVVTFTGRLGLNETDPGPA